MIKQKSYKILFEYKIKLYERYLIKRIWLIRFPILVGSNCLMYFIISLKFTNFMSQNPCRFSNFRTTFNVEVIKGAETILATFMDLSH